MIKNYLLSAAILAITSVQLRAQCTASFTISVNNQTVTLTNTSTGTNSNTNYYWSFGDNTYGYNQNEVHTYQYGGTYSICLMIYDSMQTCYSSYCDTVYISGPCNAAFTYSQQGSAVYFTDLTQGGPFVAYVWNFGDGNFAYTQNAVHTYQSPGPFYACLTVYSVNDSCTVCDSVYLCNVSASFTMNTSGDPTISFNNTSTGGNAPYYYWNFGDGNYGSGFNVTHTYQYTGTYYVCLTVSDSMSNNGCSDMYCDTVTINNAPMQPCDSGFSMYADTSNNGFAYFWATGNNIVSWFWDFGDNTTGTGPQQAHQYPQTGVYYVCLTVITVNGDTCTSCDSISVFRIGSGIFDKGSAEIPLMSYPNPFNGNTTITYTLYAPSQVELLIHDLLGNTLSTLVQEKQQAGKHEVKWDASTYAAGTYFVRIRVNEQTTSSRLLHIK